MAAGRTGPSSGALAVPFTSYSTRTSSSPVRHRSHCQQERLPVGHDGPRGERFTCLLAGGVQKVGAHGFTGHSFPDGVPVQSSVCFDVFSSLVIARLKIDRFPDGGVCGFQCTRCSYTSSMAMVSAVTAQRWLMTPTS